MDSQMATLTYNDHRSSFTMLLTIRHQFVPCTMGPLVFKPKETINPNQMIQFSKMGWYKCILYKKFKKYMMKRYLT
jgi:hypothetical protein